MKENLVMKLDRNEFAAALQKGQGRALLHVLHFGLDDVADLVLNACLNNQNYDAQVDSSRAPWLFRMFANTKHYLEFQASILAKLETEIETWELLQLCGLAKEMAANGDDTARLGLQKVVFANANGASFDEGMGADLWVELTGVDGFIDLARIYGQHLQQDPEAFVPVSIIDSDQEELFKAQLIQYAETDSDVQAYLAYLNSRGEFEERPPIDRDVVRQQSHTRYRQSNSLANILEDAVQKRGEFPGHYAVFGRHSTSEERTEIYQRLLSEQDEEVALRLLWVFRRSPMPQLDERIFGWAEGTHDQLRSAAIAALAQLSDKRIHNLARAKVKGGQLTGTDDNVLDLFINNYDEADATLIIESLNQSTPDVDHTHSFGFSLTNVTERHSDPQLVPVLRWVYENTPCMNCRQRVLKLLETLHGLNEPLRHECLFDADDDIRNWEERIRDFS